MANTYTLISSVTVGSGGAADITFSSIPSTYTDLAIFVSSRGASGGIQGLRINFNGVATNLSERQLEGDGASATSASTTSGYTGYSDASTYTANTFANNFIYIPNYAGSTNKSWSADAVTENNATTSYAGFTAGLWSNTAAISSIKLVHSASFAQYSSAYLYGIKNSQENKWQIQK